MSKDKDKTFFWSLLLTCTAIVFFGSFGAEAATVVDHTSVDLYNEVPSQYIDAVKAMRLNILGESHSTGYIKGLNLLEGQDPTFDATAQETGVAVPVTDSLRADRARRTIYNSWASGAGEDRWYTNETDREDIKFHLDWSNTNGYEVDAVGFGWCWDMTWHNNVGGTVDPFYNVRWAGSSVGGPEGDLRWGLDSGDTALTGNSINMDTYLAATDDFQSVIDTDGQDTTVFFTTGPVDGGGNTGERGYQRYLKHEHIRDYVDINDKILFDYADILTHNDSGDQNTTNWDGHDYPYIHSNNMLDLDGTYVEDGDHIGERGALRLAKAQWVLLAMIAGWDGQVGTDTTPPTILNISSDKVDGTYATDEVIDVDVTFSENVTSTGDVTVTLETGVTDRTCAFQISNASTGTCNYTVQIGDASDDLNVNSISGNIEDQSFNAMTNFTPATNLSTNKDLVIGTTLRSDVDRSGSSSTTDAQLTLRYSLALDMSQTAWYNSATTGDADCSGTTNSTDAMLILRNSLGLDMSATAWCVD